MSTQAAEPEILSEVQGSTGVATLNRPRALNALTTGMVEALFDVYSRWEADPAVACIVLKGAGDRAFCAGGDVKTVVQLGQAGRIEEALRWVGVVTQGTLSSTMQ
jgi:enoyl-CoA hydratase/carnithine racemase